MFSYIFTSLVGLVLVWLCGKVASLNRNVALARASGIPYRISPLSGIPGYLWIAIHEAILGPLGWFAPSRKWLWPKLIHVHRSWFYSEELRERLGELYLIVSPSQIFLSSSNAEATLQMMTRRNDFVKPVEIYAIVDIFGSSILTTEGADWRRHRKIVARAFSEKSNALVWRESCQQTLSMISVWAKLKGNVVSNMKIDDTAPYTATMALHVISSAGFGVKQLWDGENEELLGTTKVPGFNTADLNGSHTLAFKSSLRILLHGIIWLAIFPVGWLKKSPFEIHKKLLRAYFETDEYFRELSEYKLERMKRGEIAERENMDIMGPLVKASQNGPEDVKGVYLTQQEVVADSWIALFAGHETSANIAHYCLLFLAIDLATQAKLQLDIDSIVSTKSPATWTYEQDLGQLWNSMIGASINETLRLMPPVIDIPKIVRGVPHSLKYDGQTVTVPATTIIHLSAVGVQRNPRYWPYKPSKLTKKKHDLDDWVPYRWLTSLSQPFPLPKSFPKAEITDEAGENATTFDTPTGLFVPPKGSFIPFSEGARSCPGKRFAQIEITAILAVIFQAYSCELDVTEWASDAQIQEMGKKERRCVYEKAMRKARALIMASKSEIFLQMRGNYPVRFVKRGEERFVGIFNQD